MQPDIMWVAKNIGENKYNLFHFLYDADGVERQGAAAVRPRKPPLSTSTATVCRWQIENCEWSMMMRLVGWINNVSKKKTNIHRIAHPLEIFLCFSQRYWIVAPSNSAPVFQVLNDYRAIFELCSTKKQPFKFMTPDPVIVLWGILVNHPFLQPCFQRQTRVMENKLQPW